MLNFPNFPNSLVTFRIDKKFSGYSQTFRTVKGRKLSRLSGNFTDPPETFQSDQKLSRLSEKLTRPSGIFPDNTGTFETIRKFSRSYRNFPDYLETFQAVQKLSSATSRVMCKNFPDAQWQWQTAECDMILIGQFLLIFFSS